MPWKVSDPVSERLDFVRRWEGGERITDLCREFGISRKTAYKLKARYEEYGPRGLFDRSRAPKHIHHRTSEEVERLLLEVRRRHPTWGPKKIHGWLMLKQPGLSIPVPSTIGAVLKRHGITVTRRRKRMEIPYPAPLRTALAPNDIWCADFKGEFRVGTGQLCYPLTVTDRFSRYILRCEALEGTHTEPAKDVFDSAFREFGLPKIMRTDNGVPFAARSLWGLSKLAAHWLKLGIWPERIEPAHPEQNGQHERMHLVLKQETTRPAGANVLQQQELFDDFVDVYNNERPHEALGQRPPRQVYTPSPRQMPDLVPEPEYPLHDFVSRVCQAGDVKFCHRQPERFFLTGVLAGELVGMREVEDGRWLVTFAGLDLGHFDRRTERFEPLELDPKPLLGGGPPEPLPPEENLSPASPMCPV